MKTHFIKTVSLILMMAAVMSASGAQSSSVFKGKKRSPDAGPTIITSDKLEFDYKDFIALFDGHVVVKDPEFTLKADRMLVFFENTNSVKRVDAVGNVDLKSGDMTAVCGKATYTSDNGQVRIQTDPVVTKGENKITGEIMSIWLKEQRVVVENEVSLEANPASLKDKGSR